MEHLYIPAFVVKRNGTSYMHTQAYTFDRGEKKKKGGN
jgi:hypothetical protein